MDFAASTARGSSMPSSGGNVMGKLPVAFFDIMRALCTNTLIALQFLHNQRTVSVVFQRVVSSAGMDSTGCPEASVAGAGFSAAAGSVPTATGTENERISVCTFETILATRPM